MLIVEVLVHVKPDRMKEFIAATLENARTSLKEPGVARFDILQQKDDPTRFTLMEVYRDDEAPARHKETDHYRKWKAAVEEMMAEPRTSIRHSNVFPGDADWG